MLQPGGEPVPRLHRVQLARLLAQLLDPADVDGREEVLPRREVAVERADAHVRPPRDVLQRRVRAVLGEHIARGGDQRVEVAPRVGALRAAHGERDSGVSEWAWFGLVVEDSLRYSGGMPPELWRLTSSLSLPTERRTPFSRVTPPTSGRRRGRLPGRPPEPAADRGHPPHAA